MNLPSCLASLLSSEVLPQQVALKYIIFEELSKRKKLTEIFSVMIRISSQETTVSDEFVASLKEDTLS